MPRAHRLALRLLLCAGLAALGCAKPPREPRQQLPPRVDLSAWPTIGIVGFHGGPEPDLAGLATREFVAMLQAAQPGARVVELGDERRVLSQLGHSELDFEAVRALGERYQLDAVFVGDLEMSRARPSVRFGQSFTSVDARAQLQGGLATRLLETRTGATVWSRSSTAQADLAQFSLPGTGGAGFGANDPAEVGEGLVRQLVADLSGDFYPTWQ